MRSSTKSSFRAAGSILTLLLSTGLLSSLAAAATFEGQYYRGEGDVEYLELLDFSRRVFEPDPQYQNMPMLYTPAWNGLVEGPTWGAWWIQNSYGPTYCGLPFWEEPFTTFIENSQNLWFNQMGDGRRAGANGWVAPDGCLCDAAAPNWIYYKQGDGRIQIHDWGLEFSAAGLLLQAELRLIARDPEATARDLPRLERVAEFLDSRRDPKNNLFLAGPAGNLLAPSYAGWKRPDGTYDKAYLAGLSITVIAALDRLVELEKLAGRTEQAEFYAQRRELARRGLPYLTTEEGYFIKSLDPDGTRHGVYGAAKHGYFEAVVNHDAIALRVTDDAQSRRIYQKLASIPGLRPVDLVITNYPSLDDMYEPASGLWGFGTWVNGGHWTTCEARMILAYYRLGQHEDARRAMRRILDYYRRFRTDNPLVKFGADVYQPREPINCVYDMWGAPAAMIRGLFEYLYRAEELTIVPHVPPQITALEQRFPIRFGSKRLLLATSGSGPVTGVLVNGRPWKAFDTQSITFAHAETPPIAQVQILLGGAPPRELRPWKADRTAPPLKAGEMLARFASQFPAISANELPLRIGANTNPDAGNRFVGQITGPRIFARPLSASEVVQLIRQPQTLDGDSALIGRWDFASHTDRVFPNAMAARLPAKAVGNVSVVDSPHGKAIALDGNGYLEVAADRRLDLAEGLTLAAWIRPGKLADGGGRILDKCRVGSANGYMIDLFPAGSLRFIIERGSQGATATPDADGWMHVAATAGSDGAQAIYVNGRQVARQKQAVSAELAALEARCQRLAKLHAAMAAAGIVDGYVAAHARLAVRCAATALERQRLLADGRLPRLPPASQYAADRSYLQTASGLADGLERILAGYEKSPDTQKKQMHTWWQSVRTP